MSRAAAMLGLALACSPAPSDTPAPAVPAFQPAATDQAALGEAAAAPPSAPAAAPTPAAIGCWERELGSAPDPAGLGPSLDGPVEGCPGCETLEVGPNARGLHPEVLKRVQAIVAKRPRPELPEPVAWINSGKRDGDPSDSMHNQGLGVDVVVCGLDSRETGALLREAGFTCVIEYYDAAGAPCHVAHADLRATQWATDAYAKGGRKARTCPKRGKSKSGTCQNSEKGQWQYGGDG
jgi:hypothetical protein